MNDQPPSLLNNEKEKPAGRLKPLSRILPLLFSIILLAYFLSQFKGCDLLLRIKLPCLAFALLISLVLNAFLGAYKWRCVMKLSDIQMGYWETWKLWVGLYPITFVMPFHAGHLLYAIALKKAKNVNYFEAIENVGYDKYLNVVATFCLIGIGRLVMKPLHPMVRTWILVCALSVVAFYLVDFRVIRSLPFLGTVKRNSRLLQSEQRLSNKLYLLALATLYQSTDVISMYLACMCLGLDASFRAVVGIYPFVLLFTYIPITYSGFGAREGLVALLFYKVLTYDQAIAAGLLVSFIEYIVPAIFGLISFHYAYRALTKKADLVQNDKNKLQQT